MKLNRLAVVAVFTWTLTIVLAFLVFFDPLGAVLDENSSPFPKHKRGRPISLSDCNVLLSPLISLTQDLDERFLSPWEGRARRT